jgi:hypothetical protein
MTTNVAPSSLKSVIALVIIISLMAACNDRRSAATIHPGPVDSSSGHELIVPLSDTARYLTLGNMDTALAIFFIQSKYDRGHFSSLFQEFINYAERKDSLDHLIQNLVTGRTDSSVIRKNISVLYEEYTNYARRAAKIQLQTYHSLYDEPVFSFLEMKRDSLLLPLINELLHDPKASVREKIRVAALLGKVYKHATP